jgi:hypothetical protein
MGHQSTTVEATLAMLAGRSHGVVTRVQLLRAGVSPAEIRRRVHRGALIRVHPGVYRVGHRARSVEATFLAAVWACGDGVITHRARSVEATAHRGIPVTTVPRTLVDLAAHLSLDALARACHEAGVLHNTTPRQVEAVLAKRPTTKGATKLRAVVRGDMPLTLSELERRFQRRLKEAGLPLQRPRLMLAELRALLR